MTNKFETFEGVNNLTLRVYNRTVMLANLISDGGKSVGEEYLSGFAEGERAQMLVMLNYIKVKGADAVLKEVTRNLEVVETPEDFEFNG